MKSPRVLYIDGSLQRGYAHNQSYKGEEGEYYLTVGARRCFLRRRTHKVPSRNPPSARRNIVLCRTMLFYDMIDIQSTTSGPIRINVTHYPLLVDVVDVDLGFLVSLILYLVVNKWGGAYPKQYRDILRARASVVILRETPKKFNRRNRWFIPTICHILEYFPMIDFTRHLSQYQ